ncbi:hypothetical protein C8F01DRAFT_6026 [Mycena amicta]|nr:hypothetical protein C8F01DRAFT_6026 [Mycena amicta]
MFRPSQQWYDQSPNATFDRPPQQPPIGLTSSSAPPRSNPLKRPASRDADLSPTVIGEAFDSPEPRPIRKRQKADANADQRAFCPICKRRFANPKSRDQNMGNPACKRNAEDHGLDFPSGPQELRDLKKNCAGNRLEHLENDSIKLYPGQHRDFYQRGGVSSTSQQLPAEGEVVDLTADDSDSDEVMALASSSQPTRPRIDRHSAQPLYAGVPLRRQPSSGHGPAQLTPRHPVPIYAGNTPRPSSSLSMAGFPTRPLPAYGPAAMGIPQQSVNGNMWPANVNFDARGFSSYPASQQQQWAAFHPQHSSRNTIAQTPSTMFGATPFEQTRFGVPSQSQSQWVAQPQEYLTQPGPSTLSHWQGPQNIEPNYNGYHAHMAIHHAPNVTSTPTGSTPGKTTPTRSPRAYAYAPASPYGRNGRDVSPFMRKTSASSSSLFGALGPSAIGNSAPQGRSQSYNDVFSPAPPSTGTITSDAFTPSPITSGADRDEAGQQRQLEARPVVPSRSPSKTPSAAATPNVNVDINTDVANEEAQQSASGEDDDRLPPDIEAALDEYYFERQRALGVGSSISLEDPAPVGQQQQVRQIQNLFEDILTSMGYPPDANDTSSFAFAPESDSANTDVGVGEEYIDFLDWTGLERSVGEGEAQADSRSTSNKGHSADSVSEVESWPLELPWYLEGHTRAVYELEAQKAKAKK